MVPFFIWVGKSFSLTHGLNRVLMKKMAYITVSTVFIFIKISSHFAVLCPNYTQMKPK